MVFTRVRGLGEPNSMVFTRVRGPGEPNPMVFTRVRGPKEPNPMVFTRVRGPESKMAFFLPEGSGIQVLGYIKLYMAVAILM